MLHSSRLTISPPTNENIPNVVSSTPLITGEAGSTTNDCSINQVLVSKSWRSGEIKSSLIAKLILLITTVFVLPGIVVGQGLGLQVDTSHNVLFGASLTGEGTRLMWVPSKKAIRAGSLRDDGFNEGTFWDPDSLGMNSAAFGLNNKATGFGSVAGGFRNFVEADNGFAFGQRNFIGGTDGAAWGFANRAESSTSTAWGAQNQATAFRATVWGRNNSSGGWESTCWGLGNVATGNVATVWGQNCFGSNQGATAWGTQDTVTGAFGTAWGSQNTVAGFYGTAWGLGNKALSIYETVIGRYADTLMFNSPAGWVETDHLFVIGNGAAHNDRHNAVTVFKNGVTVFSPKDAAQDIVIDSVFIDGFKEPIIRPSLQNWGYLGSEDHYFAKTYSNNFFAGAPANYQTFSDRRLKSDINILTNSLTTIASLNPVSYYLKKKLNKNDDDKSKILQYGLIAQEVEKVLPGIVHTHPSGLKSVGYQALIPFLIKGMQEQQHSIEGLTRENESYKLEIAQLENRINELANAIALITSKLE